MAASGSGKDAGGLLAMIVDQDTATGMLLTGVGHVNLRRQANFLIVDDKTPLATIEDTFKEFTTREDISVLIINQSIATTVRHLLDAYTKPVPAILEVPSKDQPYDPTQDSILARVKFMFGEG